MPRTAIVGLNHRMASEREGLWGSPARHRSIASLKSRPHRKDRAGSCPVLFLGRRSGSRPSV